jgi:hypothetical protein
VIEELSHDHGATWSAGARVPQRDGLLALDPTDDLLVYSSTAPSIVWLSPTGTVAADVPAPAQSSFVAADDGFAYVSGQNGLQRVARDGSTSPCAAGRFMDGTGPSVTALAGGILVRTAEGPWAGTLSRDDCATFVASADLASCGIVEPVGPYGVTCNVAAGETYLDVQLDRQIPAAGLPSASPDSRFDWTFQDDTLERTVTLATPTAPEIERVIYWRAIAGARVRAHGRVVVRRRAG